MLAENNCSTCKYADQEGYCTKHSYYKPVWEQGCTFHKLGTQQELENGRNFYYYPKALEERNNYGYQIRKN